MVGMGVVDRLVCGWLGWWYGWLASKRSLVRCVYVTGMVMVHGQLP